MRAPDTRECARCLFLPSAGAAEAGRAEPRPRAARARPREAARRRHRGQGEHRREAPGASGKVPAERESGQPPCQPTTAMASEPSQPMCAEPAIPRPRARRRLRGRCGGCGSGWHTCSSRTTTWWRSCRRERLPDSSLRGRKRRDQGAPSPGSTRARDGQATALKRDAFCRARRTRRRRRRSEQGSSLRRLPRCRKHCCPRDRRRRCAEAEASRGCVDCARSAEAAAPSFSGV